MRRLRPELTIALSGKYSNWGGGIEFLRLVANGLLARKDESGLEIYLLLPVGNRVESWLDVARVAMRSVFGSVQRCRFWLAPPRPLYHAGIADYFQQDPGGRVKIVYHKDSAADFLRCLRRIRADVVLPVMGSLGDAFPVPWVGYIPDLQHKHVPANFDPRECLDRDVSFAATLRDADAVIVNSRAVENDIHAFFPAAAASIYRLPFSPNARVEWFEPHPEGITAKYGLPRRYFLICNQFWVHKDHGTAFRALALLRESSDVRLVCTGTMGDYRKPDYMAEIAAFIADHGLSERIMLLGHLPKRDQIEIMKQSVAVVQPTLFEGGPGGGCVYDAVSLGVPVILSDIPVNREVVADCLWFFKAGDSEDLAGKMRAALSAPTRRPLREEVISAQRLDLEKLGDRLLEAIRRAISVKLQSRTPVSAGQPHRSSSRSGGKS